MWEYCVRDRYSKVLFVQSLYIDGHTCYANYCTNNVYQFDWIIDI